MFGGKRFTPPKLELSTCNAQAHSSKPTKGRTNYGQPSSFFEVQRPSRWQIFVRGRYQSRLLLHQLKGLDPPTSSEQLSNENHKVRHPLEHGRQLNGVNQGHRHLQISKRRVPFEMLPKGFMVCDFGTPPGSPPQSCEVRQPRS